jgi:hypothetical protein
LFIFRSSPAVAPPGEYAAVGSEVQIRCEGRAYAEAIKAGDDPVAVARRLLRAKWDKHGAFYDPIRYPARRFH